MLNNRRHVMALTDDGRWMGDGQHAGATGDVGRAMCKACMCSLHSPCPLSVVRRGWCGSSGEGKQAARKGT
jgi:hypothetical protein